MYTRLISVFFTIASFMSLEAMAQSTQDVWQHHIAAWDARDVDEIVSGYGEESILIINSKVFKGPEEIRSVFTRLFQIFDLGSNKIDPPVLDGRTVYITWHFTPKADAEFFGTDTFVIEDGKIRIQTIASLLYERYSVLRH